MPRKSADQRRAELLTAAQRVMARGGVAAGTTRAIVAEAGMPLATFHYCFHTREDMLRALIVQLSENERAAARQALAPRQDLRETIRCGLYAYLAHLEANPGQELVLLELNQHAQRNPELHDLAVEQYRGYYEGVAELLGPLAEASHVRWRVDVATLARIVVTMIDGITTTWLADRDTEAARSVIDTFVDYASTLAVPEAG